MTRAVTLVQVEALVQALPLQDEQRLIENVSERLVAQQGYSARAQAFLKTCLESPVRPAVGMDSGEEITAMREERGSQLP